jgi:CubicO group peptidase (beta-lactamase class C family)
MLFVAGLLFLQSAKSQPGFESLAQVIEQRGVKWGDVAIMIWKDTTVFQKVTGEMQFTTQEAIDYSSAWFTAALVMYFVDQGKINLDDPVAKYLPIFAKFSKGYLTLRHCLANTTGIQGDKAGVQKIFQKNKFESLEEEVNAYAAREIVNNPGDAFSYNQIGSSIAGRVLEVVGKKSFDRLAMEKLFRPLGMKRTSFASDRVINPAAGAMSTATDYLKFLAMILNKGTLAGKKILSDTSVAEMQKIQYANAKLISVPEATTGMGYGLGNWINTNGTMLTSPALSGGWPFIDLQKKYACVIFTKSNSKGSPPDIYKEIIDLVEAGIK